MNTSDQYWLQICNDIANNSKCLSRKVGAIIVKDHKYIIATGYSGPPAGCKHCDEEEHRIAVFKLMEKDSIKDSFNVVKYEFYDKCPRQIAGFKSGEGLQYCQSAHAERNAISIAAKLGHSVDGDSIYLNTDRLPCFECCKSIITAGIKEVIVVKNVDYETSGITGRYLLNEAKVKIREYEL